MFQSLLSQGISLLPGIGMPRRATTRPFQSLLSQGISLLDPSIADGKIAVAVRFNPFLVRASVYCPSCARPLTRALARVSIPS